jgi:hypothetical protein
MRSMCRTVLLALFAVLALSAVAASAAQAEEAPFFKVAGARLAAGESKEFKTTTTKMAVKVSAAAGGILEGCSVGSSGGDLLGSAAGEPGTSSEFKLLFSGCKSSATCPVTITSLPLKATLVEVPGGEGSRYLGILFAPVKGTKFLEIETAKTGCVVNGYHERVEGTLAFELEPITQVGKESAEAKAQRLSFSSVNHISKVWKIKGGVGKEENVGLVEGINFEGSMPIELAGAPVWGVFT